MLSAAIGCSLSGAAAPRAELPVSLQPPPTSITSLSPKWTSITGDPALTKWCNGNCASGFCPPDKCMESDGHGSDEVASKLLAPSSQPVSPMATTQATPMTAAGTTEGAAASNAMTSETTHRAARHRMGAAKSAVSAHHATHHGRGAAKTIASTLGLAPEPTEAVTVRLRNSQGPEAALLPAEQETTDWGPAHCTSTPLDAPLICGVTGKEQPVRIAAGFYGVHRSTAFTAESIRENLVKPLQKVGALDVFVHAIVVTELEDGMHVKKESGVELCPKDYLLLMACVSSTSTQEYIDKKHHLKAFAETGVYQAAEKVGFRNLTGPFPRVVPPAVADVRVRLNILRSRFSMRQVARQMVQHENDIGARYTNILLARPDVGLASPLVWKPPPAHMEGVTMWLRVPNMQHYYGLNDRLAYGSRDALIYAANEVSCRPPRRANTHPLAPVRLTSPLHTAAPLPSLGQFDKINRSHANFSWGSEAKFCDHLLGAEKAGLAAIHVGVTPICNVRVRATGDVEDMDFYMHGDPSPASSCQGLNVFMASEDTKDACLGVNRQSIEEWKWKVPSLNSSLQLIHIPKTGGTTLEAVAYAHGIGWGAYKHEWNRNGDRPAKTALGTPETWQPCSPWHIPPAFYRARGEIGTINAGKQQTFCVVRRPTGLI